MSGLGKGVPRKGKEKNKEKPCVPEAESASECRRPWWTGWLGLDHSGPHRLSLSMNRRVQEDMSRGGVGP